MATLTTTRTYWGYTLLLAGFVTGIGSLMPNMELNTLLPFLGNLALVACLVPMAQHIPGTRLSRILQLGGFTYLVMYLNTGIELHFFSTTSTTEYVRHYGFGLFYTFIATTGIVYFFGSPGSYTPYAVQWQQFWAQRVWGQWLWRIPVAAFVYIVLYLLVGAMAYQFTAPYYTDPIYGLNLLVPALDLIFRVQILRSLLYVLILCMVMVSFSGSRRKLALLAGLALFVLGGLTPLLSNTDWPLALRFYHTIEIFFQNMGAGYIMVYLIYPKQEHILKGVS